MPSIGEADRTALKMLILGLNIMGWNSLMKRISIFSLEGEEYVADVAATMLLAKRGQVAESKGRLRLCSRSLIFQPDDAAASILKFPYRHLQAVEASGDSEIFIECESFVQVATKTANSEMRIVTPFSILKSRRVSKDMKQVQII